MNVFTGFVLWKTQRKQNKQNRKSNNRQKTSLQSYKTQIKILAYHGKA